MASTKFINECKNGANSNRLGKISVETIKKVSGTKLELSNTLDKKISPRLKGYTKQNIYYGKNLLNINDLSGTINNSYYFNVATNYTLVGGKTYTLSYDATSTIEPFEIGIGIGNGSNSSYIADIIQKYNQSSGRVFVTFTPTEKMLETNNKLSFRPVRYGTQETYTYSIKNIMLVEGTDIEYEPYVGEKPSPSPEYPQEIEVGRGKNLFNKDLYTYDYVTQNTTGNEPNYKDIPIYVGKPNTTYFVSTNFLNGYTPYGKSVLYVLIANYAYGNSKWVAIGHTGALPTNPEYYNKAITSDDKGYLYLRVYNGLTKAVYEELMANVEVQIEEGSVATNYLPYNTIETKTKTRNLFPNSNDIPTGYYTGIAKDYENLHNGDISIKTISAWAGPWLNLKQVLVENGLKIGDKATYSIYFKTNFVPTRALQFTLYRFMENKGDKTLYVPLNKVVPGEWIRISFECQITEFSFTSERARIESDYYDVDDKYYFGNNRENAIWFASPQFEVGDLTDYQVSNESSITYNLGDNFVADKDYIENGVLNKNIGKVVIDTSKIEFVNTYTNVAYAKIPKPDDFIGKGNSNYQKLLCTCASSKYVNGWDLVDNVNIISAQASTNSMFIGFAKGTTLEQMKTYLTGAEIYYELETPEQIPLETTGELRTYESNTIISNDANIEMEVEYSSWDTEITNSDNLTDISVEDSCYVDGQIIGTTFEKKATSQLIAVPNDVDLIDKKIKVEIGVKYGDLSNEMIKMGNYTIERPKDEQTENFTQITAYDDFNSLDNPYVCNLDFSKDVTIADFYIDVCNQLELTPMKTTFLNSDIKVTANPFVNKETLRVVLQEIEKVSCTFSEIDYETNKIDLVWLSENEEPDYEFATSDYTTLEGGKITYGPVNCLVIKESQIEGENTVRQDDESIKTNGETQIAIQDSYFLFTQALREQAIDNIWNRVKGLTYVDCKLITSYGKPFLKVGKKIRVNVNDGRVFDTYVLKHTFKYDGAFESTIESPALTKQETKVKSKSISESIRLTEIRVDKAEGNIKATTKKVESIDTTVNNNYQDIINKFGDYTPTNKVIEIENSIEQLQTDTYTKTEINTKLTDGSVTKVMTTSGTFDENGMHYEKTGAPTKSTINESGVNVESSTTGEELLFAGYDKELEQTIVRTENLTVRNYLVIGSNSRIEDYEDENGNAGGGIFIL